MKLSSPQKLSFDSRLLSVEELFRQRQHQIALKELSHLSEEEFGSQQHELGLLLSLKADGSYVEGNYKQAIEYGQRAARLLAGYPLNSRYGRIQLVLSKSYSAIGDLKNAEIRARDALAAYRRGSDPVGQVDSLNELARISYIRCNYHAGVNFLTDAIAMVTDNPRKFAQLTGNIATLKIYTGQWEQAENDLKEALRYNVEHKQEISHAINLLSYGYLRIRRRQFSLARRDLDHALEIISKLNLKREKVIYLEFAGELALEKGDFFKAKMLLGDAYQQGMLLASRSSLVSQSGRRLAEAELLLDNLDEAMKYAQKALELSLAIGERVEAGLSNRVIAQIFSAKGDHEEAREYIDNAVEVIRSVGDPYDLARTLLVMGDIYIAARSNESEKIRAAYDEAYHLFKKLKLDYWVAETNFKYGAFSCQLGDLTGGFKKLNRAEKSFSFLKEKTKIRAVHNFLQSLAEQAVALSISHDNEFKIFGSLITPAELTDLKSGEIEEILNILLKKTNGSRALLYTPDAEEIPAASLALTPQQQKRFSQHFNELLGQEISKTKPTLILDCRRDPFINKLFPDIPDVVASVIVVPIRMSDESTSYLYLDRLTVDNGINPFNQDELNFAVGFSDLIAFKWVEIQKNKLLEDNRRLKNQLMEKAAFPSIITQNSEMLEMLAQVQQVVDSNISITIEGETGSGKDILARAIHFNSSRKEKRFISVNCAALPETLLESELFGYKRGAFTGANRDKAGLFEEADGGTFFLDEIADMPLSIQAKILRVLEDKEIVRLGESVPRKVDVRIISATNKNLKEQMAAGQFRQDLYYRLSALTFRLPPLRERKEDIPLLVSHFLEGSGKKVSPEVLKLLVAYDWPGNIRELKNEIMKIVLLSGDSEVIEVQALSKKISSLAQSDQTGEEVLEKVSRPDLSFSQTYSLYDYLGELEKRYIIKALKEKKGVKKHAAALLNIPESTLRLKIKQYNIDISTLVH